MFVVGNRTDPDSYWSNEFGWVDIDSADLFSVEEQRTLHLPVEGYWVPLWSIDLIQFARFIAECEAEGVFTNDRTLHPPLERVAEAMDLTMDQVSSIIERAQNRWDEEKEKVRKKADGA